MGLKSEREQHNFVSIPFRGAAWKGCYDHGGRLGEIGYFHRVKTGTDPVAAIPRVILTIRGLGREKGPARR